MSRTVTCLQGTFCLVEDKQVNVVGWTVGEISRLSSEVEK
jgi:hypothetical protein